MWLCTDYPRKEFLQLGHVDTLLRMLGMNEDISFQLAALQLLKTLLNNSKTIIVSIYLD